MTLTLALLGFLALTLLLVSRTLRAFQRQDSHLYERQRRQRELASRKIDQMRAEMPQEESDTLIPARRG
jgi:type II secretory pathway component PulJ